MRKTYVKIQLHLSKQSQQDQYSQNKPVSCNFGTITKKAKDGRNTDTDLLPC